jgi:hypothetical protein
MNSSMAYSLLTSLLSAGGIHIRYSNEHLQVRTHPVLWSAKLQVRAGHDKPSTVLQMQELLV